MRVRDGLCACAALLALIAGSLPGYAEQVAILGDLACTSGDLAEGAAEDDVASSGSALKMFCIFRQTDTGIEEYYTGTLHVLGSRPVPKSLLWVVRGPLSMEHEPGILEQTYTAKKMSGESASGLLVGEQSESIALHPVVRQVHPDAAAATVLKLNLVTAVA